MDTARGGILTLDLSTHTGWCYGHAPGRASNRLGPPALWGTWDLGSSQMSLAAPWAALLDQLADTFKLLGPSLVVMEAPLPPQAQTHARIARLLYGLCCMTELFCWRREVPCREQDAMQPRRQLIGNVRPKKEEIVAWCQARGLPGITDHNAADAVVLWYFSAGVRS